MHNEKVLNKIEEIAYKELEKIADKGEFTPQTWSLAKEILCVLECVPGVKKAHYMDDGMTESGYYPRLYDIAAYDGYSYDNGMSERRGRNPMTGRYMSRDDGRMSNGYSMMSGADRIQPDMASMMSQLMDRMDRLEKK